MFSRKAPAPTKRRNHNLSQFGLTEIPDDFDPTAGYNDDSGNDSDLEAELAAIASGSGPAKPKPKAKLVQASELDKMVAASLRDVGSDDDDDDDSLDDPDLLGELQNIGGLGVEMDAEIESTQPEKDESPEEQTVFLPTTTMDTAGIIRQRIEMYKQAEASAKTAGEGAKARRFGRGLKTLMDLLKQANAGKTINVDDIPPEVSVKKDPTQSTEDTTAAEEPEAPKVPTRAAPPLPPNLSPTSASVEESTTVAPEESTATAAQADEPQNPVLEQMRMRQREYKAAALQSKRAGDTTTALQFLKVVKQFDMVIKMCEDGQEVDLSDMPPPPEQFIEFMAKMQAAADAPAPPSEDPPAPVQPAAAVVTPSALPVTPTSMLEALQQRLDKYKSVEEAAKAEGNAGKVRRFGRIVKQYEEAIKHYKSGRPVVYEELPVPPGFSPLPTENTAASEASRTTPPAAASVSPVPSTDSTATVGATSPITSTTAADPKQPSTQRPELTTRTSGNQQKNNIAEQQMKILVERQREFKVAALEAKKAGEIDQAKEYLKIYKGFESLLNAASSGLPVDLSTLPLPPSQRENLEESFAIVGAEECDPDEDISDIGVRVEEQLAKQLMMCKNTRDHHKAMGDIAGMNRFENLAVTVQKDLDLVRYSKRKKFALPKFHYEKRSFNIVHCHTDLNDNELEIIVVRGISYKVNNPKEVDTYVKVEFPLLNDEIFKTRTTVIKDTDNPEYEQHFKVEIQRNNRQFQRIFKRHGVKFEVYSRGGFLRSDTLIGTVNVKLQPLETKCEIHDTFDMMEGRRPCGGQLEIKLRVRNPILTKQVEHVNEKWLVLDS